MHPHLAPFGVQAVGGFVEGEALACQGRGGHWRALSTMRAAWSTNRTTPGSTSSGAACPQRGVSEDASDRLEAAPRLDEERRLFPGRRRPALKVRRGHRDPPTIKAAYVGFAVVVIRGADRLRSVPVPRSGFG